jgi:hypothetical protein
MNEFEDLEDLIDTYDSDDDAAAENIENEFQYNIDSFTNAIPVERLIDDFQRNIIKIPEFQRPYVWNRPDNKTGRHRPSLFIDSILLGLPIPPITVYKDPEAREEGYLIDGRQRLMTMSFFTKGQFQNGKEFKLKGENIYKDWQGKAYKDLPENLKDRFNRTYIPVMYIRQLKKDLQMTPGASSIYLLFDRLNSGGYALTPHEKRGVLGLNNNRLLVLMKNASQLLEWRDIFPHSLMNFQDKPYNESVFQENVFRTIAFSLNYEQYEGNITRFLDKFMVSYSINDPEPIIYLTQEVLKVLITNKNIDKFFRPRGRFSISLFESVFVACYRILDKGKTITNFEKKYQQVVDNGYYLAQGSRSLSNKADMLKKFNNAYEIFNA